MTYQRVCNNNMTGANSGAGTAYNARAPLFTPEFLAGFVLLNFLLSV